MNLSLSQALLLFSFLTLGHVYLGMILGLPWRSVLMTYGLSIGSLAVAAIL